ncbi:phage terminase small subunit [Novosphingobium sp. SL115]|uniref:phage terminase small subunit n=1 Tax=Novosphingobium sp. SL115 TaxID=2995150 RepID=UPI0022757919|nr:phage terminase small subunit [Novosphingobium sp. SL115]MCY1672106.1 phage terminase small subunit [Novosphingobium sp. SL115]
MFSPALRHRQRVLAQQSAQSADTAATPEPLPPTTAAGQEYAALRVLLHDNLRTLSDIASHEARIPVKIEMARAFAPWIDGVLAAEGQAAQDEIVVTNLVWAIDYRDFEYALRLATHAIRNGLAMPERFTRTPACYLVEEVSTIANAEFEAVNLDTLVAVQQLAEGHDMPDPVRAKLHKAIGRRFEERAEKFDPAADNAPAGGKAAFVAEAQEHLQRAFQLDRNVGVKKDIERLERKLKALTAEATPPQE